ncbi:hypothetical protein [Actinoplanes sp. NPDC089786]|uniref:hypothetical protein n=1 Tax=Actinoplanes sp. NPDC089786 TaxID=3155185 RepID=UPI00343F1632
MNALMIGGILGAVFGAIAAEVLDLSAWLAPRIVHRAAQGFPSLELRTRYEAEWMAELEHYNGLKVVKLGKALAILASSLRTAKVYRGEDFVGITVYLSRLIDMAPMLFRYAWRGSEPGGRAAHAGFCIR